MLPLARETQHRLKIVRHVLGHHHLQRGHDILAPVIVALLVDNPPIRVNQAKAAEGLVRSARVDAVDVHESVLVLVVTPAPRNIESELPGKLLQEPDDELVDVRLMQILVELEGRQSRSGGGVMTVV